MINFKHGAITNTETGMTKDIVVKAACPNSLRDTIIGGSIILVGIAYLTITAFKNGAQAFEAAEYKTLSELNLFK